MPIRNIGNRFSYGWSSIGQIPELRLITARVVEVDRIMRVLLSSPMDAIVWALGFGATALALEATRPLAIENAEQPAVCRCSNRPSTYPDLPSPVSGANAQPTIPHKAGCVTGSLRWHVAPPNHRRLRPFSYRGGTAGRWQHASSWRSPPSDSVDPRRQRSVHVVRAVLHDPVTATIPGIDLGEWMGEP